MFLVTTSDERTWKTDEKILFLGEWCKLYKRKDKWSRLDYRVAPYHWDDRGRLYKDYNYLEGIYENYLRLLSDKLNIIHGCNHSARYWRIIIGPWLRFFIEVLYDRYLSIAAARDSGEIHTTFLLQVDPWNWVPDNVGQFYANSEHDSWNGFIYSEIIKFLDVIPYQKIAEKNLPSQPLPAKKKSFILGFLFGVLRFYSKLLPDSLKKVVFFDSGFGELNTVRLSIKLKQVPYWFPDIKADSVEVDKPLRKQLQLSVASSEFESLLESLLPLQIPKIYLEGFVKIRDKVLQILPKQPTIIITANGYNSNDIFKIWAAEKTEKDTKLVIVQHGGTFGMALWVQSEDHQIDVADKFFIWGRPNREEKNLKQMSAGKIIRAKKNIHSNSNGPMYMVLAELPTTSYWMYSIPVASQFLKYIDDQFKFIQHLNAPAIKTLKVRLFPHDYGWSMKQRFIDKGLDHIIDTSGDSFVKALNKHKLCISTYNSTTYLETLAADYPTILFWNQKHFELRPKAQPYFDALIKVGILHETPQSAAKLINKIYKDPQKWWRQPDIQAVKNEFCAAFVKADKDWKNEWATELKKMCASESINNL
ncbi:MAG: hypothetical protein HQL68_01950 [Magnetococcales bacterium]|nr:hypothetical protein [Magnetococcales bacterium]